MALKLGYKGAVLGLGEETTWGVAVTPTKFIELTADSLNVEEERLHTGSIPKIYMDDDEVSQSNITAGGEVEFEMRYEGMEYIFKHAMGSVSTSETASFTVDATNNKLDFNIGGSELTATITLGTYPIGTNQATSGSLCKAIYDAIVAAEPTGTYTVSYSTTTKKVTITRSSGTFNLLWYSGTNHSTSIGSLIGFSLSADDTGSLSYESDNTIQPVYTHTFTLTDELPTGLTAEVNLDTTAKTVSGCKINTLALTIEQGGFLKATVGLVGKDMTMGTATASVLPTAQLVTFSHGTITYNSTTKYVKTASFTHNNNLKIDRRFIGSRLIYEPKRSAKIEVTGTFTIDFEDTAEYTDFRNATSRELVLVFTSTNTIKSGVYYTITITFPIIKLTSGVPMVKDAGPIELELPFKAYATDSSTREFNVVINNTLSSI